MGSSSSLKALADAKSSSSMAAAAGGAGEISDEILNTFTAELAHAAYLSISRLNSG